MRREVGRATRLATGIPDHGGCADSHPRQFVDALLGPEVTGFVEPQIPGGDEAPADLSKEILPDPLASNLAQNCRSHILTTDGMLRLGRRITDGAACSIA
jgi:hypothetical protein